MMSLSACDPTPCSKYLLHKGCTCQQQTDRQVDRPGGWESREGEESMKLVTIKTGTRERHVIFSTVIKRVSNLPLFQILASAIPVPDKGGKRVCP